MFIEPAALVLHASKPAGIDRAEHALSGPNLAVHSLSVPLPPSEVAQILREPNRLARLGHDLLFRANPDTRDSRKWDPSYLRMDARTQSFGLSAIERRAAEETFLKMEERLQPLAGAYERRAWVELLVDELLSEPGSRVYQLHWDNRDDTNFDGLMAIDPRTGKVRVLMVNDFA